MPGDPEALVNVRCLYLLCDLVGMWSCIDPYPVCYNPEAHHENLPCGLTSVVFMGGSVAQGRVHDGAHVPPQVGVRAGCAH